MTNVNKDFPLKIQLIFLLIEKKENSDEACESKRKTFSFLTIHITSEINPSYERDFPAPSFFTCSLVIN